MDRFIERFRSEDDGDLILCRDDGVAYQKDRTFIVNYDDAYYNKCLSYEDQDIAKKINAGRVGLVNRHIGDNQLVDIGIGSGEFIKKRPNTFGFDVNPVAIEWLKRNDLFANHLGEYSSFSFWDVIEHVETPEQYLKLVPLQGIAFFSLPIFYGLGAIRLSKHYRPGEHLYYWTEQGFCNWMTLHGFMVMERATFEIDAGRESIYSYAFKRIKWPS